MSRLFKEIIKLDKVFSTNDTASETALIKNDNFVIIADEQVNGRGQRGKEWNSPIGGLWFSIFYILKEKVIPFKFNVLINNSIIDAIHLLYGENALSLRPKWPNDIYINDKKLCGILIEGIPNEYYIIGVGINTNNKTIYGHAISLRAIIKKDIDNDLLLEKILDIFTKSLERNFNEEFMRWKNTNILLNKKVEIKSGEKLYEGIVSDIEENGTLLLDNEERIVTGEVIHFE